MKVRVNEKGEQEYYLDPIPNLHFGKNKKRRKHSSAGGTTKMPPGDKGDKGECFRKFFSQMSKFLKNVLSQMGGLGE